MLTSHEVSPRGEETGIEPESRLAGKGQQPV